MNQLPCYLYGISTRRPSYTWVKTEYEMETMPMPCIEISHNRSMGYDIERKNRRGGCVRGLPNLKAQSLNSAVFKPNQAPPIEISHNSWARVGRGSLTVAVPIPNWQHHV